MAGSKRAIIHGNVNNRAGSLMNRVREYVRAHPSATGQDVQRAVGKENDISQEMTRLRKEGLGAKTKMRQYQQIKGTEKVELLFKDLSETIEPLSSIARKHGIYWTVPYYSTIRSKTRGPIFTNKGKRLFGITASERYGLDPERLRLEYEPLPVLRQKQIFDMHIGMVQAKARLFPVPELREEFKEFALGQLRLGISKYAPEMCSQRHFVLLVLANARRKFARRMIRGENKEMLEKRPVANTMTQDEISQIVGNHYTEIAKFVARKANYAAKYHIEDVTQESVLRAMLEFDRYDRNKHGTPLTFMRSIALGVIQDFNRADFGERLGKKALTAKLLDENEHIRNKPKYTKKWD